MPASNFIFIKQKDKMKKILVATDFSEASRNALFYAASLAKAVDGHIILVNAYFVAVPTGDFPGYMPTSFAEMQQEQEALMQREIELLLENYRVRVDGYVRSGTAAAIIEEVANEINADLLIMGMKGAEAVDGIFGSAVTSAIRNIQKPLLIIPANAKYRPVKRICFAADFGKWPNEENYKTLVSFVQQFNAGLRIFHVENDTGRLGSNEVSGKIRADLLFDKLDHHFHTVVNNDIEQGIYDFIEQHPADMLVMVAHHHNLFERIFGTIHTKSAAYGTLIPLLVLHD